MTWDEMLQIFDLVTLNTGLAREATLDCFNKAMECENASKEAREKITQVADHIKQIKEALYRNES